MTASTVSQKIQLEKRTHVTHAVCTIDEAYSLLLSVEANVRKQKNLGLGDPSNSSVSVKSSFREIIARAQANELANIFTPVKSPDEFFPRAEKFRDYFRNLPEVVVCHLRPGTTHVRCSVGRFSWWNPKNFEASIPLMPQALLELVSRAKDICPEAEFHIVMKPSWQPAPQLDPVLLLRVPLTNEYFQIGAWDGDSELIQSIMETNKKDEQ
jgi:hypothetical protein